MTDINLKLIKLIEEGKTINEITAELDMTNKQILRRLNDIKIDGIDYDKILSNQLFYIILITKERKRYEKIIGMV